jgi:hypothetical protein
MMRIYSIESVPSSFTDELIRSRMRRLEYFVKIEKKTSYNVQVNGKIKSYLSITSTWKRTLMSPRFHEFW